MQSTERRSPSFALVPILTLRVPAGFTLLEILIVTLLLGILAMIAWPTFNSAVDGSRLSGASSDVVTSLEFAQLKAMNSGRRTRVTVDAGAETILVEQFTSSADFSQSELAEAVDAAERDESIGAIVLTGSEKAFAAGADIKQMKDQSFVDTYMGNFLHDEAARIERCRKPVIAAVAGYALGGGCELAMMCDFIIAADNAKFGQPEIKLGVVPGIGGTQRLTSLIGKSKAMDLCLTGRMMDVDEAERAGLVARVEPLDSYLEVALQAAADIAAYSQPVTRTMKYLVNSALETSLAQGLGIERQMFKANFALDDQKEGMAAFVEKRSPDFKHR